MNSRPFTQPARYSAPTTDLHLTNETDQAARRRASQCQLVSSGRPCPEWPWRQQRGRWPLLLWELLGPSGAKAGEVDKARGGASCASSLVSDKTLAFGNKENTHTHTHTLIDFETNWKSPLKLFVQPFSSFQLAVFNFLSLFSVTPLFSLLVPYLQQGNLPISPCTPPPIWPAGHFPKVAPPQPRRTSRSPGGRHETIDRRQTGSEGGARSGDIHREPEVEL